MSASPRTDAALQRARAWLGRLDSSSTPRLLLQAHVGALAAEFFDGAKREALVALIEDHDRTFEQLMLLCGVNLERVPVPEMSAVARHNHVRSAASEAWTRVLVDDAPLGWGAVLNAYVRAHAESLTGGSRREAFAQLVRRGDRIAHPVILRALGIDLRPRP